MKPRCMLIGFLLIACHAMAQRLVTFPIPNQPTVLQADLYGEGHTRGLILAHGGRFNKESWRKQADILAQHGFLVLAIRYRGDGPNPDGSPGSFGSDQDNAADVLAAVAYLHSIGIKTISAIGGSLGGDAVGVADATSPPGTFDRIVVMAASGGDEPEKLKGRKLFIVARKDIGPDGPRLIEIEQHYAKVPGPKKLVILDGSAHAQFLFDTPQGQRLMSEILKFLTAR